MRHLVKCILLLLLLINSRYSYALDFQNILPHTEEANELCFSASATQTGDFGLKTDNNSLAAANSLRYRSYSQLNLGLCEKVYNTPNKAMFANFSLHFISAIRISHTGLPVLLRKLCI